MATRTLAGVLSCAVLLALVSLGGGSRVAVTAAAGGDKDCTDFDTQKEAQNFFESHRPGSDPHQLDGDGDGVACETLPCPCDTGGGGGNNGGGGGGNKPETKRDRARFIEVIDGDTIRVSLKGKTQDVRLIGIDTPEVYNGAECGGPEASASAQNLLGGANRVLLISDPSQDNKDRYDRLLRYVEYRGKDINRAQVSKGWANVYVYNGNPFRRVGPYRRQRDEARKKDRGVWGKCGGRFQR